MPAAAPADPRWAAARAAVRELVAQRLSPALAAELLPVDPAEQAIDCRTMLVLDASLPWDHLAAGYPRLLAPGQRKQHGTWFTPPELALPTARRTLAPLLACAGARLRIVDPAAGGGTFLLAALHELRAAGVPPRDAALSLHGVDVDGTAAALAALALWSTASLPPEDLPAIAAHVRPGDGLLDLPPGTFDAVLTNPPWETLQSTPHAAARVAALRPRFRHQGSGKLYTYRLFVERAFQLARPGGRFGLCVPASLWFDREAAPLRELLLDQCSWEWLYGFENRRKLFAIDGRYRFGLVVGAKGGRTTAVRIAFGRTAAADWAADAPDHVACDATALRALSPHSGAFVEVEHQRDLDLLQRMVAAGEPLCGPRGRFAWRQGDFNMTTDRDRFVLRSDAEAAGFRRGDDAVWRCSGDELLPLQQGAMLLDLHPNAGAHRHGTGHATAWEDPASLADVRPQYLVAAAPWRAGAAGRPAARIALRALSNATNERTAIACLLPDLPCGNSLGVLAPRASGPRPLLAMAAAAAVLSSLAFDHALRLRLTGTNLNGFVLADCVLPRLDGPTEASLAQAALRLCALLPWHQPLWRAARDEGWAPEAGPAADPGERRALHTAIDVLVGRAYGLSRDDVAWIVRGCDLPAERLRGGTPGPCHPRGFWRIDRTLPRADRRPNRWLAAAT